MSGTNPATAANPVELFSYGVRIGNAAAPLATASTGVNGTAIASATNGNPTVPVFPQLINTSYGFTPVVTATAASFLVLKGGPGLLYHVDALSTVAGYLMLFNAVTAPADGTVTPVLAVAMLANTSVRVSYASIPELYTTGITAVFSTTGPFTKTASATAFIHGCIR